MRGTNVNAFTPDSVRSTTGVRDLTCCVCGEVTRGRQWWNHDKGFGLCAACIGRTMELEGTPEAHANSYGVRGIHFDLPAAVPAPNLLAKWRTEFDVTPMPEGETWNAMIARTNVPGRICEVGEDTYMHFLECVPPRFQRHGCFGFGEGSDEIRLFWRAGGKFLCRQLTEVEHAELCEALGIRLST